MMQTSNLKRGSVDATPAGPDGRRRDSKDAAIPPAVGHRKGSITAPHPDPHHDVTFEKRRDSFQADHVPAPVTGGRRGSVDIFEGLPMSRRGSISPLAPKLEAPSIDQVEHPEGDHILFRCRITSDTEPEVTWYHLEDRIKNDARHKVYVKKDTEAAWMASMEIKDIVRKDAGKYSVRAKNACGENYATVFSYIE